MSVAFEPTNRGYIAFIDEAGDPGLTRVRPIDANGASEWLVLGAVLIQASREAEPVEWVRSIREAVGSYQRPDLHFRFLHEGRKRIACEHIAALPLRCFALLSNKKNMRGHRNERAESRTSTQEWFYNFCVRLLLERITDYVAEHSSRNYNELRHVELVFSNRGGMRYGQTIAYIDLLRAQARSEATYLDKRVIKWEVLNPKLVRSVEHRKNAGVQLADVVASAFYHAADALGAKYSSEYAKLLEPRLPKENGTCAGYSVALQPSPPYKAKLTDEQKEIFEYYGYRF